MNIQSTALESTPVQMAATAKWPKNNVNFIDVQLKFCVVVAESDPTEYKSINTS